VRGIAWGNLRIRSFKREKISERINLMKGPLKKKYILQTKATPPPNGSTGRTRGKLNANWKSMKGNEGVRARARKK